MDMRAAMDGVRAVWSVEHVCRVARDFLAMCGWKLETGEGFIQVPSDTDIVLYSAAVIMSDYGFGDHIEAIVYLGVEHSPPNFCPMHGVLRLYLNTAGDMITEDRYSPAEWIER